MRFLFVSKRGASLSLAKKIAGEGHKVNFFINNLNYKLLGEGIVDRGKISDFSNYDIVIFDEMGLGEYASKMSKVNKLILGSSNFADLFNEDIEYKTKVLSKCNLQLNNSSGEVIYTTGAYTGFDFIRPFYSYFKKTKFMENDLSTETESMGCLLFYHKTNKIIKETLYKLRNELKKIGYKGHITFKCSVTENDLFVNDVHFGFEYDSFYASLEGLRQPLGEFLYGMAIGSIKRAKVSPDWLCSVRLTIPPYPFETSDKYNTSTTIGGICDENLKHLWLRDVYLDNGVYKSANCDGYILSVSARGLTPNKGFRRCYRTIDNLQIKDKQFRRDILTGLEDRYDKIKIWGWFN